MPQQLTSDLTELSQMVLSERLGSVPALVDVPLAGRAALAGLARPRSYRRGEKVLEQDQRTASFFILLQGRVKMTRTIPVGRNVVLSLFGPGDLFGSAAALSSQACDSSMVALEHALCLEVRREDLFRLFEERPELVGYLLPILTRHLVECGNCIVELSCHRVEPRFAQLFLKLADSVGEKKPSGVYVPVPLSRQELADMTGTSIETCIRVMSRWGKQGVVETEKGGFLVIDRAALRALARG
ncbi:MAG: Crp/Fnr family transcriptional regulator [bacterium]|nr:Crp/Fnr family transcriptional regulator [bacterium]